MRYIVSLIHSINGVKAVWIDNLTLTEEEDDRNAETIVSNEPFVENGIIHPAEIIVAKNIDIQEMIENG